jgi:hypothetical protein
MSQRSLNGVVTMSGIGLREQGDTVSQVVSDIDTTQFRLTLAAVVTPAADNSAPITVEWMAYV